jgi:hypothetical protein
MPDIPTHSGLLMTTVPMSAAARQNSFYYPEFTRLPRTGERCPISGLSRSALNALILGPNPPVKSICLRRRGAARGVRLIVTASLLEYLRSQIQGGKS